MRNSIHPAAIVALLAFAPAAASAGTTGMIDGIVFDEVHHRAVPNAIVTASSPQMVESVRTDSSGHYRFMSLTPGRYIVSTKVAPLAEKYRCAFVSADEWLRVYLGLSYVDTDYWCADSPGLVRPGTTADVYTVP